MSAQKNETRAAVRTRLQKTRILDAARTCFEERGFHAASMAAIAETAGMSPGLIYRYFENKSAIIRAIIEHQLTVARRRIQALPSSRDLGKRIVDYLDEIAPDDEYAMSLPLYLEISAQAARDPHIAEALRRYDAAVSSELGDWMQREPAAGGCGLPAGEASMRAMLLLSLIEGLKLRMPRETVVDRDLLKGTLDEMLESLLTPHA